MLSRSALASPPRILFCFCVISVFFFWYGAGRRGRVSPKGETDGILSADSVDSVLRKLFSGDFDFRKTETNLFLYFVRPQKGVWGMNAGGLLFCGNSEKQNVLLCLLHSLVYCP